MSSVDIAADYARKLVNAEARGPGDIEPAMHRIAARTGVGYWRLWGLWHRRRKTVDGDLLRQIRGAYWDLCEQQIKRLQHDLALDRARGGNASTEDLDREVEALVARLQAAKAGRS